MNLTSPTQIKKLLKEEGGRPDKRFGQNFLINKGILEKIIKVSDLKKDDVVLEVGPGLGVLTKELARKAGKVIAVEKDRRMVSLLKKVLEEEKIENVEIINEDILDLNIGYGIPSIEKSKSVSKKVIGSKFYILNSKFKLIANIPYNITSVLIRKFLESERQPEKMILMIQKEVAQRICQMKKMSLLSLSVQFYANTKILFPVSKGSFFPAPKIDSAIIEIVPKKKFEEKDKDFFRILKLGFSSPRKQLLKNLSDGLGLGKENLKYIFNEINLNEKIRAEDLSLDDWIKLTQMLK